jgi:hypothetical protein
LAATVPANLCVPTDFIGQNLTVAGTAYSFKMITIEGAERNLAENWINVAAAITAQEVKESKSICV